MNLMSRHVAMLMASLFILFYSTIIIGQTCTEMGRVTFIKGPIKILKIGEIQWRHLAMNDLLCEEDKLDFSTADSEYKYVSIRGDTHHIVTGSFFARQQFAQRLRDSPALMYLLNLLGVSGIVGLIAFIPFSKMVLGVIVIFLGAFFPIPNGQNNGGEIIIRLKKLILKFRGGIRLLVVTAGIILVVGAMADGCEAELGSQQLPALPQSQKILSK